MTRLLIRLHAMLAVLGCCGIPAFAQAQGAPVIERVEPTSGPPGTLVDIIGRRFGTQPKVSLGVAAVEVVDSQPNRIHVRIGADTASGNVTVVAETGTVRGPEFRVTPAPPPPSIDGLDPERGPPGTEVVIRGKNFSAKLTGNVVTLAGHAVVVQAAAPNALRVTVPEAQSGPFVVRVAQSGEAQSPKNFEVTDATAVTEVQPPRGGPGTEVVVRGKGFSTVPTRNRVYLNNVPLTVKSATASELVVQLPSKVASGKLLVDVQGAGRAWSDTDFIVLPMLRITGFTPQSGPAGTEVVLSGQGFGDTPAQNRVTLGGQGVSVLEANPTRLKIRVPKAKSGPVEVSVPGNSAAHTQTPFVVTVPPEILDAVPREGPVGTDLTIRGRGFGTSPTALKVTLADRPLEVRSVRDDQVVVRVVAGSKSGRLAVAVPLQGKSQLDWEFKVAEATAAPAAPKR